MELITLQSEMIKAMKAGDKVAKDALSSVICLIQKTAIDKKLREDIPDSLVNECLLKEKKTITEMIDTCPKDREDLKSKYQDRLNVINEYCPKLITDVGEIKNLILDICGEANLELAANNRGPLMKTIMPKLKGKVDMKQANQVINSLLK